MSAVVRRLRPATNARLAVRYVRAIASHKPLMAGVAVLFTASVLISLLSTQNDDDVATDDGPVLPPRPPPGTDVDGSPPAEDRAPTRLFVERPLVLLTLSYHAAPIYDLMDQLQPLGVQFIERGINAYACRYFGTCRQDGLLEACPHTRPILIGLYKNNCPQIEVRPTHIP